jgi:hypothetical protein
VSPIRRSRESKLSKDGGKLIWNLHHDIDVVGQEGVALGPKVDGHAFNDDRMNGERCRRGFDHRDDLQGALGKIRYFRSTEKIDAKLGVRKWLT